MPPQFVSCRSLIEQTPRSFVNYHQQLGHFYSDWHQHEWGQLIYAEKGYIHLNSQEKRILIPSWYGVWIPPNTDHEIWSNSSQIQIHSICFPVAEGTQSLSRTVAVFPVSPLLREMIRHTERWIQQQPTDLQATTFLQVIEDLLPDELKKAVSVSLPSTTHPKLQPIIQHIQDHLAQPIRFQGLCREFGLSMRTLSRLFTQQLGTSFSSYCKIARIMKALELIELGGDNVSQLAAEVGYESLATFSNNFLAIYGHRPHQFIRNRSR